MKSSFESNYMETRAQKIKG